MSSRKLSTPPLNVTYRVQTELGLLLKKDLCPLHRISSGLIVEPVYAILTSGYLCHIINLGRAILAYPKRKLRSSAAA